MLLHYFPTGMLGLGPHRAPGQLHVGHGGQRHGVQHGLDVRHLPGLHEPKRASDRHYLLMGHFATFFGTAISIGAAYVATRYNNIMDLLQLVFAFVKRPCSPTFLLGMFWKRTTGHGAFIGLLSRHPAAASTTAFPAGSSSSLALRGGWITAACMGLRLPATTMVPERLAQNFGDRGLDDLLRRHDCGQPVHRPRADKETGGTGLFPDAPAEGRGRALVPVAGHAGRRRVAADRHPQLPFLVGP